MVQKTDNRLLRQRNKMKRRKPSFRRPESWRYVRVKESWRKSIGIDSMTRRKEIGGATEPNVGYRSPNKVRGLHPSGYEEVRVENMKDLEGLSPKKHAIKISARLGAKKRIALIEYLQNKNFKILNLGTSQKEMESLEAMGTAEIGEEELLEEAEEEKEEIESEADLEKKGLDKKTSVKKEIDKKKTEKEK